MQTNVTHAAANRLWREYLSRAEMPFLQNSVMGGFVLDFYCPKVRLAVTLHAEEEQGGEEYRMGEYLRSLGVRRLRFSHRDVSELFPGVVDVIRSQLCDASSGRT